jgi:protein MpaA
MDTTARVAFDSRKRAKWRIERPRMNVDWTKQIVEPLDGLARSVPWVEASPIELHSSTIVRLPRYLARGPLGGGDPIRIGVFAGIHGDEPSGCHAIVQLAREFSENIEGIKGYEIYCYPVCNPTGLSDQTRHSRAGKDLNREFWRQSSEPEVILLEREIQSQRFHGLISLHADDTSSGMYGFVRGAVLTRGLLMPALLAAERILPRNLSSTIDGFAADEGIISCCYDGILTSPPDLYPTPFEIILETPNTAPLDDQVRAFTMAIRTILIEYRKLLSFAADL